jgi:hypothetical protein
MGYGVLTDPNALRHAYGITNTNHIVWLPIMNDPCNNWYNMYGNNDDKKKELIIQIANKAIAEAEPPNGRRSTNRPYVPFGLFLQFFYAQLSNSN